jgi:hypothetical protein
MDKMYDLMERDEDIIDREAMGIKAMQDLRRYIKTYTDIDTKELYDGE